MPVALEELGDIRDVRALVGAVQRILGDAEDQLNTKPEIWSLIEAKDKQTAKYRDVIYDVSDSGYLSFGIMQKNGTILWLTGTTANSPGDGTPPTSPSGGSGILPRSNQTYTTGTIADNGTEDGLFEGLGKLAIPHKITASSACWIRIYKNTTYQTADAARDILVDATGEHGLVLEFNLSAGNLEYDISPQYPFSNPDGTSDYPITVKNLSGSSAVIDITVSRSILEI